MKRRWILEAFGAALVLTLPFVLPLLLPEGTALLHNNLSLRNPLLGLMIDIAVITVLGLALLIFIPRLSPLPQTLVSSLLACLIVWWLGVSLTGILQMQSFPTGFARFGSFIGRAQETLLQLHLAIPLFFMAFGILMPGAIRKIVSRIRLCLAAFAFCGLWIIPQLVYLAMLRPIAPFDRSTAEARPIAQDRIVWILFDELSYDLVFDHPVLGEKFPNFERLKSQSVSFANMQAGGLETEKIVPALLAGREIDTIRSTGDGSLLFFDQAQHRWVDYDAKASLFGSAQEHGWNPGVAGWYNPYCRIFQSVLTACAWRAGIQESYPLKRFGAKGSKSPFENSLIIPAYFFNLFLSRPDGDREKLLNKNILDYQAIMAQAQKLIRDDQIRFIFIHLPVPHPPGVYNRASHQLCECGNYLDNLALADDSLNQLQKEIDASTLANRTTMIISSDHSWRVPRWRGSEFWTQEEEHVAETGWADPRPVFLMHFPGQQSAVDIAASQSELIEHDIVAQMLLHKMSTSDDLVSFLQAPHGATLGESHKP